MRPIVAPGLAALVTALTTVSPAAQPPLPSADLVLVNGTVLTVDARDTIAEAIAITGGKIVAVGTSDAIRARSGAATRVIDLRGRT